MDLQKIRVRIVEETVRTFDVEVYAQNQVAAEDALVRAWEDHEMSMFDYFKHTLVRLESNFSEFETVGGLQMAYPVTKLICTSHIEDAIEEANHHNAEYSGIEPEDSDS